MNPRSSTLFFLAGIAAACNGNGGASTTGGSGSATDGATAGTSTSGGSGGSASASGGTASTGDTASGGSSAGTTSSSGGSTGGGCTDPALVPASLGASTEILLNPERGFYRTGGIVNGSDLGYVRADGKTLMHTYVRLDDWRTTDLPGSLLASIDSGLAATRSAGIKLILRFAYNFGPYPDSDPDAPKDWILTHISQLTSTLQGGADAIAVVQAGFIGAWGEWHSSTNDLLANPQDKFDILNALVDAVPESRMVQLRYPPYKGEGYGGPLDPADAFGGSRAARIGHHNDCFLASDDDFGTYPVNEIDTWKQFVASETRFVAMGGETCNVNPPRSECATALAEMEQLHFTYINHEYLEEVVSSWTTGGCRDELERRLGYRLETPTVEWPAAIPPGAALPLRLTVRNTGFAAPINPRDVVVVLDGPQHVELPVSTVDVRRFAAGEDTVVDLRLPLPADLPAGTYSLGLWLPDASPALRADSRYAIRLANEQGWDDTTGVNDLGDLVVDPTAPGCPP